MTINVSALLPTHTRFRTLLGRASGSSPLAEALASIPEWTTARDRLAALGQAHLNLEWQADAHAQAAVDQLVRDAVERGESIDSTTLEQRAVEVHSAAMGAALVAGATTRLRTDLAVELETITAASIDTVLTHLDVALNDLLTEGRTLSVELRNVTDLESAVDAGLVESFRRMRDLGTQYAHLRQDQSAVFSAVETQGRAMRTLTTAYLSDPISVDPDYIARTLGAPVLTSEGQRRANPAPWPEDWDSEAAFTWQIATPEAKPWVPTTKQLTDLTERIDAEIDQARREMNDRRSAAINPERAAYRHYMLGTAGQA